MLQWRLPFQNRVYNNHQYEIERPSSDSQNHPAGISVVVDQIKEDNQLNEDIGDNLSNVNRGGMT